MPLFHIQDNDRPGYVVAETYAEAESKWRKAVLNENDGEDYGPPNGITLICTNRELMVEDNWVEISPSIIAQHKQEEPSTTPAPVETDGGKGIYASIVTIAAYEVYCSIYGSTARFAGIETNDCGSEFSKNELVALLYARSFSEKEWPRRYHQAFNEINKNR